MRYSDQVVSALQGLHPGVRKDIRRALAEVDHGRPRDVRPLVDQLDGFWRLRVGKYRIIFRYQQGEMIAEFLGPRASVDQDFSSAAPSTGQPGSAPRARRPGKRPFD